MWTFVVSDRRAGHIPIASPNVDESYNITPQGEWVPTVDVDMLLEMRRMICCPTPQSLQIVFKGTATVDKPKPDRKPGER